MFHALLGSAQRYRIPPGAGDFRLLDRLVVEALLALPERTRFMKGLYAWVGFDTAAIPYTPRQRANGASRFGALRLLSLSLDGLTALTRRQADPRDSQPLQNSIVSPMPTRRSRAAPMPTP